MPNSFSKAMVLPSGLIDANCTPSFRKWDDEEASESWAFLFTPAVTTEEAWTRLLRRDPQTIEWTEVDLRALLDPGLATRDPGALAAALLPLRGAGSPRVVSTEALSGNGVTAVDFAADLPGGGTILGSVHARRLDDGTFRILWIATPGGSWPRLDGASREGLSTSGHGR